MGAGGGANISGPLEQNVFLWEQGGDPTIKNVVSLRAGGGARIFAPPPLPPSKQKYQ